MPKFSVWATVKGTKYLGEFEAETAEKAIELAGDSDPASISLCHQCSSECQDPGVQRLHGRGIEVKPADELAALSVSIADLGEQIERKRARFHELVAGATALDRSGKKYIIDRARVYAGGAGYHVYLDGPLLTKSGNRHSRTRVSTPFDLLVKISRDGK